MEITARGLWTAIHGMGFGALYLLACSGAIVELLRRYTSAAPASPGGSDRFLQIYLITMAVLAWLTVLTGTYIIYPWYRAAAPPGTVDLAGYPQRLLLSSPATSVWHSLGMEWKEHVAWLVPIATTMAAAVAMRYRRTLRSLPQLRKAVLGFLVVAFLAGGIAGFFGAMLNKSAPVQGGPTLHIASGEKP